jgi:hypothetical protein
MIVWGWRTVKGVSATGEFYCPHCSTKRPYQHQKLRRWFTLYFIPVIPVGSVDEQITCGQCRKSWQMSVLGNDPEKLKANQLDRIARDWLSAMAAIAVSRGGPTPEVAQIIVADLEAATGRRVGPAEVGEAGAGLSGTIGEATIVTRLGSLPADLSSKGQELFLQSALNVLRKLTNCGPAEIALTRALGAGLGVSGAHVKGILLDAGLHDG